jgi:hypothetical protein
MAAEFLSPAHTTTDASNRITLPKQFSERLVWIKGSEAFRAWLFLVSSGRYRLLSEDQVQQDSLLEPVRSLILDGKLPFVAEPTAAQELRTAAMVARLAPISMTPPGPGWRFSFPKVFEVFGPPDCVRKHFTILLSLEGYLEIWYTDLLRRAVLLPSDER